MVVSPVAMFHKKIITIPFLLWFLSGFQHCPTTARNSASTGTTRYQQLLPWSHGCPWRSWRGRCPRTPQPAELRSSARAIRSVGAAATAGDPDRCVARPGGWAEDFMTWSLGKYGETWMEPWGKSLWNHEITGGKFDLRLLGEHDVYFKKLLDVSGFIWV